MKLFLVLCFAALALAQDKYDASYDNFDISEVLGNERLLANYSKCLLDKGPCVPSIAQFKERLPEILETKCAKCSEKQKSLGRQMAREMKKTRPQLWNELVKKYDPSGKHRKYFDQFLKD